MFIKNYSLSYDNFVLLCSTIFQNCAGELDLPAVACVPRCCLCPHKRHALLILRGHKQR